MLLGQEFDRHSTGDGHRFMNRERCEYNHYNLLPDELSLSIHHVLVMVNMRLQIVNGVPLNLMFENRSPLEQKYARKIRGPSPILGEIHIISC